MKRSSLLLCAAVAAGALARAQAVAILEKRCGQCHGESTAMSDLKLTSRENLLRGGSRGAAVSPGNPDASLLYQAVKRTGKLSMPPGAPLPPDEIEILRAWIAGGAEWPAGTAVAKLAKIEWWAFEKPRRPTPPVIAGASTPIDAFVLQKIRAAGIEPAPPAGKLTLLRRACYDLLGLPPTAEQIQAFLKDASPQAWEHVVDALLASPRYGEKLGRHWLDLARYGDTSGFEQDPYILEGWRYRDYVVKSFNDDKPYDKFAKEQIAGDELYPDDSEARTGTGFYRVGANRDMLFKVEDLNRLEKMTDAVDTTSAVFLGLTVGCARCHDHKFDPISQRDYYRMQAIFAPAVNERVFLEYNNARFYDIAANSREFKLRQMGEQIGRIEKPYREKLRAQKIERLAEPARTAMLTDAAKRTPAQQTLAAQTEESLQVAPDEIWGALSQADSERLNGIAKRLVNTFSGYGPPPTAPGIVDVGREAPRTYIALRGNPAAPGEEVRPGFLSTLGGGEIADPPPHASSTGRRRALAEWLASADNPLFARVLVNRVWQYLFGWGLVRTPSDFGVRAGRPSHPELLDWLATEFAAKGWSIKALQKEILLSDAYQRSANPTAAAHDRDPENALLSHMNRRRLEAEEIRDAALEASGSLNLKMGGIPVVPPLGADEMFGMIGKPENAWAVTPDASEFNRRSIYMFVRRTFQQPMFEAFDRPDGVLTCARRNESTTAPQSLALLNGRFMMEQARALSSTLHSPEEAWQRIFGRVPTSAEQSAATEFLAKQTTLLGSREAALTELARALMNTNEFLYVD